MKIINYTPHAITVSPLYGGHDILYPPSGTAPRVEMTPGDASPLPDGCTTITVWYGAAELPEGHPRECIVSTMFADA
jgi:hypothetical protein